MILRDDCALTSSASRLLPTLKHVHDTTDFPKSLGHARAIAGLILSVWWMRTKL